MGDVPVAAPSNGYRLHDDHSLAVSAGKFKSRRMCAGCGVICLPDFELRAWVGVDVDLGRFETDPDYEPPHTYPFPDFGDEGDDAFTRRETAERAQDALGAGPEPVAPAGAADIAEQAGRAGPRGLREAMGFGDYIDRARAHGDVRRELPSRSPEARRAERVRAIRRARAQ